MKNRIDDEFISDEKIEDFKYNDEFSDEELEEYIKEELIEFNSKEIVNSNKQINTSKAKKGVKITSIHKGHRERVLNKFIKYGISSFTDFEVLEFLLFFAIPYRDTNVIAHKLIDKFGSLKAVMEADHFSLCTVDGIGERAAALIVLFREFHKYISTTHYTNDNLHTSQLSAEFCMNYFKNHVDESFIIISLDAEKRIKCVDVISVGNETETAFYLRDVVKVIVKNRATNVILAHNHPDNNPEPSSNDLYLTNQLTRLLKELGAVVIDHIICSSNSYFSFSDKGFLKD